MAVLSALVMESKSSSWRARLPEAVLYYNLRPFEGGLSPFEVFKGRKVNNPWNCSSAESDELWPSDEVAKSAVQRIEQERKEIYSRFENIWKEMRAASMREVRRKGGRLERFSEGQYVYIWIPRETRESKLGPRWEGPFRVDRVLGEARYQVGDRVEHSNNMKRVYWDDNPGRRAVALEKEEAPGERLVEEELSQAPEERNITQKAAENRAPKRKSSENEEDEEAFAPRVQPSRLAKTKRARLAAVLLQRPKGDLLWL